MNSSIVCALLLSGSVAWAADAAPTNAAPAAANATPAPAAQPAQNSADADWNALMQELHVTSADPLAAQKQAAALLAQTQAFADKYPSDPRAAGAVQLWMQVSAVMRNKQLPGAPTEADVDAQVDKWATDPKIPVSSRAHIRGIQVYQAMVKAAQGPGDAQAAWDAVEVKIADFQKEFGNEAVGLRQAQLSILKQNKDTARYNALLQKLAADPNPALASMAKRAQDQDAKVAELQSKPLDLKFTAADGTPVDLSKLRGKVVLLDFWATWCGPCVGEVPHVVEAYQKYHGQGFEIVGVSLDQDKDKLLAFTKGNGMVWPQYFDGKGWKNDVSSGFGIDAIPAMWLFGKDGKLITMNARADLAGQVEKALQAP